MICWVADAHGVLRSDDHTCAVRYEELASDQRTPDADNAVIRLLVRDEWCRDHDPTYDAAARFDAANASDVVIDDRRRVVSIGTLHGTGAMLDNMQAQDELFGPTTFEPVAVRGECLALLRTRALSESGFELRLLAVAEINDEGVFNVWTFFDEDDDLAAIEHLDSRAGRAPHRAAERSRPRHAAWLVGLHPARLRSPTRLARTRLRRGRPCAPRFRLRR